MDRDSLRDAVAAGETFDYLFFWGHTPRVEGVVDFSCFSQWYLAEFEVDGVVYRTAEHYMMAEKARLFGDEDKLSQILVASTPAEAKKLGRRVSPFDQGRWNEACFDIVVCGSLAKFAADPRLFRVLLGTGDRVLVEASPRDRVWGIGMGRNNPLATNPAEWRGRNLLGFALMEARERLRSPCDAEMNP